ncbi:MAG: hypothetical protein AAGB11_14150 [Pseudomonadota bacterium]
MPSPKRLCLKLFGPFAIWWEDGDVVPLRSSKGIALIAMLATAPGGRRTRAWLQRRLWESSGSAHGRASLRQSLTAIKKLLGPEAYSKIFILGNESIRIRLECISIIGSPQDGSLLEDLDIASDGFRDWREETRAALAGQPSVSQPPALTEATATVGTASAQQGTKATKDVQPVLAVLPFPGADRGKMAAVFGDAVALEIGSALSSSRHLNVISHLTARAEILRLADLETLKLHLGVDYVVTGQVRLQGDRFRLDVDFIDARTGHIRWTQDFTGLVGDFFAGGNAIVPSVCDAIWRTAGLTAIAPPSTNSLSVSPRMPDLETHQSFAVGSALLHHQSLGSFSKAREHIEAVVEKVPFAGLPLAWLSQWYLLSISQGWSVAPDRDLEIAKQNAVRAIEVDPGCAFAHAVNGIVHHHLRRHDEALSCHTAALSRDPNNALASAMMGVAHTLNCSPLEAVASVERASRLSPLDPQRYLFDCVAAGALAFDGDNEGAIDFADRAYGGNRRYASTLRVRAFLLERLGRHEEAIDTIRALLEIDPRFATNDRLATTGSGDEPPADIWGGAHFRTRS